MISIDATGIHSSTYAEDLLALQNAFYGIFGSDALITPDTQDGQLLAITASAQYDAEQAVVKAYQSFSPLSGQGVGLSNNVKINGMRRLEPSYSVATATIGGVAGTPITNGVVQDDNGVKWDLPASVVIPFAGTIDVSVTCELIGAVAALPGTITTIATPTRGWQSVTNAAAAVPGAPTENDFALRQRQARSTALPALSIVAAIRAAIANTTGVQRVKVYENDTGSADADGIPANSISAVVQGATSSDVAQAIANRKPPGTRTYGSTTVTVLDPKSQPIDIHFYQLAPVTVTVNIRLKALAGWQLSTEDAVKAAVARFVSGLEIGEDSYAGRLYAPANLQGSAASDATGLTQADLDLLAATFDVYSVTQSRPSNPVATTTTSMAAAAATAVNVATTVPLYIGQNVRFILDNAANFDVVISSIAGSTVNFVGYPVPAGRNIPNGANVYLLSDVVIAFNEGAIATAADVVITVV